MIRRRKQIIFYSWQSYLKKIHQYNPVKLFKTAEECMSSIMATDQLKTNNNQSGQVHLKLKKIID